MDILSFEDWTSREKNHIELVGPIADAFLERRATNKTHAVQDFLFTYYRCSPKKLKQWVPSFEQCLILNEEFLECYPWLLDHWFMREGNHLFLKKDLITENTKRLAAFIANLCEKILASTPRFSCFGLHEWAMVYKLPKESLRHQGQRLRLSPLEIDQLVESQTICCSHYDAYRFFSKDAKPLNILNPQLVTRLDMEQGGCLHANMDLYKWSSKLWPWIGSELIAKTFLLSVEGRTLDMQASPYDLCDLGYPPLCIETPEGRKLYQEQQQLFAKKSALLRQELHSFCFRFLHKLNFPHLN